MFQTKKISREICYEILITYASLRLIVSLQSPFSSLTTSKKFEKLTNLECILGMLSESIEKNV